VVRALLTVEGDQVRATSTPNLNLALVLDRSGSMAGGKLAAAKQAATQLVQRMAPEHRASVVVFDHHVETLVEGATADSAPLTAAIASIDAGGNTNLSGGWLQGRTLAARSRDGDRSVNRIILMTDGHANEGITDRHQLTAMCRAAAAEGISTSTVGFGAGYDEDLLKAMADAGNGNTWYIERIDQAASVFLEEIEGLLSLAAQNLSVTLTGSAAVRDVVVWGEWPTAQHGDHLTVTLGDLYAREPRRLLVEFVINNRAAKSMDGAVAEVRLESDVLTAEGGVHHVVVTFPIAANLDEAQHVEPTIETQVLLAQAAKARKEAAERQERGDIRGAANVLREAAHVMQASPQGNAREVVRELRDLHALEIVIRDAQATDADVKYLKQRAYNHSRGRAHYDQVLSRPQVRDDDDV
jgi:Ca-activated chloride channel family protein